MYLVHWMCVVRSALKILATYSYKKYMNSLEIRYMHVNRKSCTISKNFYRKWLRAFCVTGIENIPGKKTILVDFIEIPKTHLHTPSFLPFPPLILSQLSVASTSWVRRVYESPQSDRPQRCRLQPSLISACSAGNTREKKRIDYVYI